VLVAYRWAAPDHGRAAVMTRPRAVGSARLVLRPRAGVNLFWEIPRCALAPAGSVIFDAEAWLALPMRLELLTVGDSDPAAPFGEMRRWSV